MQTLLFLHYFVLQRLCLLASYLFNRHACNLCIYLHPSFKGPHGEMRRREGKRLFPPLGSPLLHIFSPGHVSSIPLRLPFHIHIQTGDRQEHITSCVPGPARRLLVRASLDGHLFGLVAHDADLLRAYRLADWHCYGEHTILIVGRNLVGINSHREGNAALKGTSSEITQQPVPFLPRLNLRLESPFNRQAILLYRQINVLRFDAREQCIDLVTLLGLQDVQRHTKALDTASAPARIHKALLKELINCLAQTERFTERIITCNSRHNQHLLCETTHKLWVLTKSG